jgi:transcriptional regulator with XRE-family HTH domain
MAYTDAASLIRDARQRHRVSQTALARRAQTSARHVGRIERGEVAPSVDTLQRLLVCIGERLELSAVPGPRDNRSDADVRAEVALSPGERVAEMSALARSLHSFSVRPVRDPPLQGEQLLRLLGEHRVEFVVIGGFALSAHGVIRATANIDVVPAPGAANLRRLGDALREVGVDVLQGDDLRVGDNQVVRTRLGRVDVMQAVPGVDGYRQLREGSIEVDVPAAGRFPFAGCDDLIAMKRAAGRPQDEIDIVSLERARLS